MLLRTRAALTALLVALPAALVLLYVISSIRSRDMAIALERVVTSQINDQVKERCESDPMWFLAGPLNGRPKGGQPQNPDAGVLAPRAKAEDQPFELFAFDEDFLGSSTASPRFPNELRFALRTSSAPAVMPFSTPNGTGVQVAAWTGWITGPCAVFLGRMRPVPNAFRQQLWLFAGLLTACYAVAIVALTPTVWRIRRLARDARQAADEQHASIAPDRNRDEISAIAFVYNDTVKVLHERAAGGKDRDEALRRFIDDVETAGQPLAAATGRLGAIEDHATGALRDEIRAAVCDAHDLGGRLANVAAAAELHARRTAAARETIDLGELLSHVVAAEEPFARAKAVTVTVNVPRAPIAAAADRAMLERAIANLVDNAIRYSRPGGQVTVSLTPADGRFSVVVRDNGMGVSDEEFKGLTAIRRFRGDEGRDRRPGVPGLGLAVAREVIERLGWKLDLGRPASGGLEVEVNGTTTSPSAPPR